MRRTEYPYSLDPQTERAFLIELKTAAEIALWRVDEIESCARELRSTGRIEDRRLSDWSDIPLLRGEIRIVGAIEAFLAAWARISLILYPDPTRKKGTYVARGLHMRRTLGMRDPAMIAGLYDRDLRNGWMHLDEDLEELARERETSVAPGIVGPTETSWADLMTTGAVRLVDPKDLTVTLARGGAWSLWPYFRACKDVLDRTELALRDAPGKWHCVDGYCGKIVLWGPLGRTPAHWMIRTGGKDPISVECDDRGELLRLFAEAVARRNGGDSRGAP